MNVDIGTSTLYQNLNEELVDAAPITFGTVPVYQACVYGVEKFKNPLNTTDDDFLTAFEKMLKMV